MSKAAQTVAKAVSPQDERPQTWGKYQLLPPMSHEEYAGLKDRIRKYGVRVPVEIDENGDTLDGHHRAKAAEEIAAETGTLVPYPTITRTFESEAEKRLYVVALNVDRRHLTDGQRAIVAEKIEPDIAERARLRKAAHQFSSNGGPVPESFPEPQGEARDEVAQAVGIGTGRTYDNLKKTLARVRNEAPDLMPMIEAGEMTLREARAELNKLHPKPGRDDEEPYTVGADVPERNLFARLDIRGEFMRASERMRLRPNDKEQRRERDWVPWVAERFPIPWAVLDGDDPHKAIATELAQQFYRVMEEARPMVRSSDPRPPAPVDEEPDEFAEPELAHPLDAG